MEWCIYSYFISISLAFSLKYFITKLQFTCQSDKCHLIYLNKIPNSFYYFNLNIRIMILFIDFLKLIITNQYPMQEYYYQWHWVHKKLLTRWIMRKTYKLEKYLSTWICRKLLMIYLLYKLFLVYIWTINGSHILKKYDNLMENVIFSIRTQAIKSIIHFCFLVNAICLFALPLLTPHWKIESVS